MCGIVGIVSNKDCIQNIISGLKALEYRGYDSSGIAISDENKLEVITETFPLEQVNKALVKLKNSEMDARAVLIP